MTTETTQTQLASLLGFRPDTLRGSPFAIAVKRTLKQIPFVQRKLADRYLIRRYDMIMNASFQPDLYSRKDTLRISEIEINKNCNLNCVMCNTALSQRAQQNMDFALFEKVLKHVSDLGQRVISLHTIGEPLLNPHLEEYFKITRAHGLKLFLSTNCLLLEKRMDVLVAYADIIQTLRLSIDGATKETYEKIRRPAKFDVLLKNLDYLKKVADDKQCFSDIRINSIVSKDVQHELGYHIKCYSKYVNIRNIELSLVSGLSPDNTYFMTESILKNHIVPWHPCDQLFSSTLHVLNDGRTTACCRDYNGDLVYGSIEDGDPKELINNERVLELRKQHLEDRIPKGSLCASCFRVDPRVAELFRLFVSELIDRFANNWEVDRMQGRFDEFFSECSHGIPAANRFVTLFRQA
jgi:wyosine [tRNA(Phe)-imidazoG37] synthetase (radical SAM superfamily)